jgi:hypothetical protein
LGLVIWASLYHNPLGSFERPARAPIQSLQALQSTARTSVKYDKTIADANIKRIQDSIALTKQQPDSPEKQKSLDDLANALKGVEQYAAGVSCTVKQTNAYTLDGSVLHTGPTVEGSSDCPGYGDDETQDIDSVIELNGNTMKVTDGAAIEGSSGLCPKGDKEVDTFTRIGD